MVVLPILLALAANSCDVSLQPVAQALQQNDLPRASSLLESLRGECSAVSSFYALTGVTAELSGKTVEAEAAFRKAISLDPHSAVLKEQLGATYLRNQRPAQAVELLREALTIDPANVAVKMYLAGAYVETNSWKEAAALFDQLGTEVSGTQDAILRLWFARTLVETQQFSRLDREFLPAATNTSPALLFTLGTLLAQHGMYAKAVNYLNKIPKEAADDAVYFNLGLACSHLGEFNEARQNYFFAIDKHPEHVEAYFRIGLDYGAAGDGRKGIPWLFRARQLAPTRVDIRYALVQQLIQLSYFDTAEQILSQTSSEDPLLLVAVADLKQAKGDAEGALKEYRRILVEQPAYSPALIGLARAEIALAKNAEAHSTLLAALANDPGNVAAQGELGVLESQQGSWDSALQHLRGAWAQDRSSSKIGLALSRTELHLDHPGEALKVLEAMGPVMQRSPAYHLELARVYDRLSQADEAQQQRKVVAQLQAEAQEGLHFDAPKTYIH